MSATLADITLTLNTTSVIPMGSYPLGYVDWIVIINASPFALNGSFGGNLTHIPAWYYFPVYVGGSVSQAPSVTPYLQTIPGAGFTNTLSTVLYMTDEKPPIQLPQPLGGGPVDLTIASSISQNNQPPGNSVIFAEPTGDTSVVGAVNLNNEGQLILGDATYAGTINLKGPSNSGNIQLNNGTTPNFLMLAASTLSVDIDIEPGKTVTNGNTAGTITIWEPFRGAAMKVVIAFLNGFRTTTTQNIALPVAFTSGAFLWSGFWTNPISATGCGLSLLSSGVAQSMNTINAGGAIGSTAVSSQGTLLRNGIGEVLTGFDTLSIVGTANWTANGTGWIVLVGV